MREPQTPTKSRNGCPAFGYFPTTSSSSDDLTMPAVPWGRRGNQGWRHLEGHSTANLPQPAQYLFSGETTWQCQRQPQFMMIGLSGEVGVVVCPFVVVDLILARSLSGLIRSKARSKAGFAVLPRWDGRAGGSRILAPEGSGLGVGRWIPKRTVGRERNFRFSSFTARMAGRNMCNMDGSLPEFSWISRLTVSTSSNFKDSRAEVLSSVCIDDCAAYTVPHLSSP